MNKLVQIYSIYVKIEITLKIFGNIKTVNLFVDNKLTIKNFLKMKENKLEINAILIAKNKKIKILAKRNYIKL